MRQNWLGFDGGPAVVEIHQEWWIPAKTSKVGRGATPQLIYCQ
jgi:hypothetical protein